MNAKRVWKSCGALEIGKVTEQDKYESLNAISANIHRLQSNV